MTRACLIVTLSVAWSASAFAQPGAVRLTLAEAVTRAFETSHRLAESQAREEGARATVQVRQAASRPSAAATAGYSRTNHVVPFGFPTPDGRLNILYPDVPDNFSSRVGAQWPIYTAGRLDALERAAFAEANAAGADIDTTRADLRFEVTRAYWAVATSREAVRVLQESVSRADAQVRDARQRLDVGLVPPSDVLTFEAQRSSEELQLIEATNQLESTLIDLRRLIGAEPAAVIELADSLDSPEGTVPMTNVKSEAETAPLVAEALKQRPELRALAFRFEGAQAREVAASKGRRPNFALGGGYDFAKPNPKIFPREDIWQTSWDVSLNMSWNIFDSGRTKAEVAEAIAAGRAIEARQKELDAVVSAEVRQRLLDLKSSQAAVRASETGVRASAEARRVLAERLAVGVATTTDVLVAQEQLLDAELARARALASVRLAEARLQRALGRP
ncbi:MAG TPA: TolC family protein [Vicinamibacterales bacterium]|nr:TolC family protein [Vicinamibacterales bacterium]